MAADVVNLTEAETLLGGQYVKIMVDGDKVFVNDAQVVLTDVAASNGVIHVIDSVILPPADIIDTALADERFSTLAAAIQAAGLVETLKGKGPFTVFAPTNDAFAKLPAGTVEDLLKPENKDQLDQNPHLPCRSWQLHRRSARARRKNRPTVEGEHCGCQDMTARPSWSMTPQVIVADVTTRNGIIHVIDSVILPPS